MIATSCRGCGGEDLEVILSLGAMPLANALVTSDRVGDDEARYPLDVAFCKACALVQLTASVPPEELFSDYSYFSSYADTVVQNADELVHRVVRDRRLGSQSLAMEIASNDGYLLQHYVRRGVPVLGIDPAANVVEVASQRGVPTLCAFFDSDVAEGLRAAGSRADVVHANNVFAHVPGLNGFARGISRILAEEGVLIIETPYVRDLVERLEFDTVYHEHVFYYSLTSLERVLVRNGLHTVDVEHISIHGGSLRVFATLNGVGRPDERVTGLLEAEARDGITSLGYYRGFGERVRGLCAELRALLVGLASAGKRVVAYGAAAKGAVLLNALGLPDGVIEFVADRSPHKQGRYMPGVRIPIVAPERLLDEMPDVVLLLAWNFADEVMEQQAEYRRRGGRFIVPVPAPVFV